MNDHDAPSCLLQQITSILFAWPFPFPLVALSIPIPVVCMYIQCCSWPQRTWSHFFTNAVSLPFVLPFFTLATLFSLSHSARPHRPSRMLVRFLLVSSARPLVCSCSCFMAASPASLGAMRSALTLSSLTDASSGFQWPWPFFCFSSESFLW